MKKQKKEITFKELLDGTTVVKLRGGRATRKHRSKVIYDRKQDKTSTLEHMLESKLSQWHDDEYDAGKDW